MAAGLELQATWHARTWDRTGPATTPWLAVGSPFFRHAMAGLFHTPEHWDRMLALPQTALLTDELRDRERVVAGMHRQWAIDDADVQCLSHGDCRFDAAMASVRRHHLHGVMWGFCPPEMQDPDDCAEMCRRHAAAAIDHDTLGALTR